MRSFTAAVAFSALSVVAALNGTAFTIDPTEVDASLRNSWCIAQRNTCITLCDNNPDTDTCEQDTLDYSCLCSNGSAPGLQYYTETIETFVCKQAFEDCINANVGSQSGQQNCTDSIDAKCGTLDPTDYSASGSTSASASASGTASDTASVPSASASQSATSNTTSAAGALPNSIQQMGAGAAAAAIGLFAYML